jgi:hypothetical protein
MISNDYTTTSPYGLVVFQDFGFHPFGGIISDYQNILFSIYHLVSLMEPMKSNLHFMKGSTSKEIINLVMLFNANLSIF